MASQSNGLILDRRAALMGAGAFATAGALGVRSARAAATLGELCFLNLGGNKVMNVAADGTGLETLVTAGGSSAPDGIAYDPVGKHIYWSTMGRADVNDGMVLRCDLDGKNVTPIVPAGGTFTAKQLKWEGRTKRLYWSDREGMRVMRCNADGTGLETLVQTGDFTINKGEQNRWCVGVAVDVARGQIYWTQKGGDNAGVGVIRRAGIDVPKGQTPTNRTDIETLFAELPEPIDMDLDLVTRRLYWTDRGDNTVSCAPMELNRGTNPARRTDREILVRGLKEAIGIYLDLPNQRMFYTSLGGEVGTAGMNGAGARMLLTGQGSLTGITMITAG